MSRYGDTEESCAHEYELMMTNPDYYHEMRERKAEDESSAMWVVIAFCILILFAI